MMNQGAALFLATILTLIVGNLSHGEDVQPVPKYSFKNMTTKQFIAAWDSFEKHCYLAPEFLKRSTVIPLTKLKEIGLPLSSVVRPLHAKNVEVPYRTFELFNEKGFNVTLSVPWQIADWTKELPPPCAKNSSMLTISPQGDSVTIDFNPQCDETATIEDSDVVLWQRAANTPPAVELVFNTPDCVLAYLYLAFQTDAPRSKFPSAWSYKKVATNCYAPCPHQ